MACVALHGRLNYHTPAPSRISFKILAPRSRQKVIKTPAPQQLMELTTRRGRLIKITHLNGEPSSEPCHSPSHNGPAPRLDSRPSSKKSINNYETSTVRVSHRLPLVFVVVFELKQQTPRESFHCTQKFDKIHRQRGKVSNFEHNYFN
ncbi:unnamed protein product [Prunus armeniaca]